MPGQQEFHEHLRTLICGATRVVMEEIMEDQEHLLTFYAFPASMHRHIQTTNAIESFFSNVRQRTNQIDAFTTEASCISIVWAVMQDIHFHKVAVS